MSKKLKIGVMGVNRGNFMLKAAAVLSDEMEIAAICETNDETIESVKELLSELIGLPRFLRYPIKYTPFLPLCQARRRNLRRIVKVQIGCLAGGAEVSWRGRRQGFALHPQGNPFLKGSLDLPKIFILWV